MSHMRAKKERADLADTLQRTYSDKPTVKEQTANRIADFGIICVE